MYVALEWDHKIADSFICYIVVECFEVVEKFGKQQALPPRKDIAYFVNQQTAKSDAEAFANIKNKQSPDNPINSADDQQLANRGFVSYEWDHNYLNDLICNAVLYWEDGKINNLPIRADLAYFVCKETAKFDAERFAQYKTQLLLETNTTCVTD